jgi:acetolactate synthase-1/2/3 large subunit
MNKVSNIIAKILLRNKIKNVFAITGGASIHLIHSISKTKNMRCIFNHHEQASAMGADGLSRSKKLSISCAVSTSGPGATNLITGMACSWFDSIPVLFITGQVTTFRLKNKLKIRQLGFQETGIISIVKSITKYSNQIRNPYKVLYEIEKAIFIAKNGRPGPVLLDIPDDVQRMIIDEKKLIKYTPNKVSKKNVKNTSKIINLINKSKRPAIIFGSGINKYSEDKKILNFLNKTKIPFLTTWGAKSLLNNHKLNFGTFGTHGTRSGNFCVQNSDLLIVIGSRLSTRETGSPIKLFARDAKIIIVDIDIHEILKFKKLKKKIFLSYNNDSLDFISQFMKDAKNNIFFSKKNWISYNLKVKETFKRRFSKSQNIDPYYFVKKLNDYLLPSTDMFVDTGSCLAWIMQDFKCSKNQKIYHDLNFTAMGWALPASIGAYTDKNRKNIVTIVGDGSLMVNLQEIILINKYCKKLKLFIINNKGYAMVQQTEGEWLNNENYGTTIKDLSFPNFKLLSKANKLNYTSIKKTNDLKKINKVLKSNNNEVCEVFISPKKIVIPQVKFGSPIEDAHPLLKKETLQENMLIKSIARIN